MILKMENKNIINYILILLFFISCNEKKNVDSLMSRAKEEMLNEQYQDAVVIYDKVLKIDSLNTVALNNRAMANYYLANYYLAIPDYSKLIMMNKSETAYLGRARCYKEMGLEGEELMDLNELLILNPNNTIALNSRGLFYTTYNQPLLALDDFNRAILLEPKNCVTYLNRGLAYQRLENKEKTLIDFNEANKLCPEDADILHNRGKYYAHIKQQDKALIDLEKAISLNPNNGEIYYSRGIVYLTIKEQAKACEDFYKAGQLGYKKAIQYSEQYCKN